MYLTVHPMDAYSGILALMDAWKLSIGEMLEPRKILTYATKIIEFAFDKKKDIVA